MDTHHLRHAGGKIRIGAGGEQRLAGEVAGAAVRLAGRPSARRSTEPSSSTLRLRAVTSTDGMTADYYPLDHAFLGRVANPIINEVRGINRVTYDITSKPPGTIEWE